MATGVIVSLVPLSLADRQRTRQEYKADARRRDAVLAAIVRELRNRHAMRGELDDSNAHAMVGAMTTVAFEAHAGELATIAPQSGATVYEHYGMVGRPAKESARWNHPELTPTRRFATTGSGYVRNPALRSATRPPRLSTPWG